ncbi:MAG: hypothetical protein WC260_00025 [Candidatus Pacearchaeota archaeon]
MKKRGQVTLFIILGILVVSGIISAVLFSVGKIQIQHYSEEAFKENFDKCIYVELENQVDKLYHNAGFLEQRKLFVSYNDKNYSYLCYSQKPYEACTNYYPNLEKESIQELKNLTQPLIEQCFENIISEYKLRDYEIYEGPLNFEISFLPNFVSFDIKKEISLTKSNITRSYFSFSHKIESRIYNFLEITNRIINDEASYSFFDDSNYMLFYPTIKIDKIKIGEINIYEVSFRDNEEQTFNFAVRRGAII